MKTFTRIPAPKFRMGRYTLNEYELRYLMLQVAQGHKPGFIGTKIKDESGNSVVITEDGTLSGRLPGLHINTEYAVAHMDIKNKNRKF